MRTVGNVIWFVFLGGFWAWLLWLLGSLLAFVCIIGIPRGRACFNISNLAAVPFGKEAINRHELTLKGDVGTSGFGMLGNLIWFVLVGFWLALLHLAAGVVCCITIIGIPFGVQHFKLAGLAIAPIGKTIVTSELAAEARANNARSDLARVRSGASVTSLTTYDDV